MYANYSYTNKGVHMEHTLHYKLRATHINCQKSIVQQIKKTTDLKPGEPKILEFLMEHEPCEQKEIAAGCDLNPSSVTGILMRMERRNLIKREAINGNRRSLYVSMTEHGKNMSKKVEEAFEIVDQQAVEGLTQKESAELMRLLDLVNHNLLQTNDKKTI